MVSRKFKMVAAVSAALFGSASFASAALVPYIGVNFNGSPSTALASGTSAGVVAQTNYNNEGGTSGTGVALLDNTGASTGVTLTYTSAEAYNTGASTVTSGNQQLLYGLIDGQNFGVNAVVTLNNVPAGTYSLIDYTLGDNNQSSSGGVEKVALTGGATYYLTSDSPTAFNAGSGNNFELATNTSSASHPLANYVEFDNITLAAPGSISYTTSVDASGTRARVEGFQLLTASSVPEPTSIGLLGIAALGLMKRRRQV